MTTRFKLKPASGCLVRHPGTYQQLAADGESVEMKSFWLRKLRDGDVIEVPNEQAVAALKGEKQ